MDLRAGERSLITWTEPGAGGRHAQQRGCRCPERASSMIPSEPVSNHLEPLPPTLSTPVALPTRRTSAMHRKRATQQYCHHRTHRPPVALPTPRRLSDESNRPIDATSATVRAPTLGVSARPPCAHAAPTRCSRSSVWWCVHRFGFAVDRELAEWTDLLLLEPLLGALSVESMQARQRAHLVARADIFEADAA